MQREVGDGRSGLLGRVLSRLERAYGRPAPRRWGNAVDVLVETILSQNTSDANSSGAFANLKRCFPTWDTAADAPVRQIERCIRSAGLARRKAPRIRAILRCLRAERGRIGLEFLRKQTPEEACRYLTGFDGVGPKTALCVLLFAFRMPVFPVDTHIARIARRLGVLPAGVPDARAHEHLGPQIAPRDRYAMHLLLIAHGRRICRARAPKCERCCLLSDCAYGQRKTR